MSNSNTTSNIFAPGSNDRSEETEGFQPTEADFEAPTLNPAPVPELAEVDPWGFLGDLTPIDVDTEQGGAILALHTAQLTWGMMELKRRLEFLEEWAEQVGEILDPVEGDGTDE